MSYSGKVSLLICSLMALLVALALPFVTSDLRPSERSKIPWRLAALALVGLVSGLKLVQHAFPPRTKSSTRSH